MKEEMLHIVNEDDEVVRTTTRREVRENALLHRDVTVVITNPKDEFLVQKRSMKKDIYPGFWDLGVSEAVKAGESYSHSAARGLHEELDITVSDRELKKTFLCKFRFSSPNDNRMCAVYSIVFDGKIRLLDGEVSEYKFITKAELKEATSRKDFHPVRKMLFEKYLQSKK